MGKTEELRPKALEAARAEYFSPNPFQSTKLERAITAYLSAARDEQAEVVARPANCRNRLRDEGKPYPKSGCDSCRTGGLTGCPYERSPPSVAKGGVMVTREMAEDARDLLLLYGKQPAWAELANQFDRALSGDEGREAENFPVTLGKVHQAIDGYVQALYDRQHGGVAEARAFAAICGALGRSPAAELDARRLPTTPSWEGAK